MNQQQSPILIFVWKWLWSSSWDYLLPHIITVKYSLSRLTLHIQLWTNSFSAFSPCATPTLEYCSIRSTNHTLERFYILLVRDTNILLMFLSSAESVELFHTYLQLDFWWWKSWITPGMETFFVSPLMKRWRYFPIFIVQGSKNGNNKRTCWHPLCYL